MKVISDCSPPPAPPGVDVHGQGHLCSAALCGAGWLPAPGLAAAPSVASGILHPVPHCWPGCWHRGESSASCAFLAGLVSRALHVNMLSLNSPLKSSSLLWPKVHLCARHITRGVKNLNKKLRLGLIVFKIFNWLRLPGLSCSTWAMNSVC